MKMQINRQSRSLALAFVLATILASALSGQCRAQNYEPACAATLERWTKTFQQLEDKLKELSAIQQIPAERIVQRPLLDGPSGKTIAKRISDALQAKDELLNSKRTECRELLSTEEQIYSELQPCLSGNRDTRNKDGKKLIKLRTTVVEQAGLALADVKEVEGKDTGIPYSEAMGGSPNGYRQGTSSNWQSYQQMYRRWWGY
jgi:hypothetical protein